MKHGSKFSKEVIDVDVNDVKHRDKQRIATAKYKIQQDRQILENNIKRFTNKYGYTALPSNCKLL